MEPLRRFATLTLVLAVAACSEQVEDPAAPEALSLGKSAGPACAPNPDFVATDEASLLAALGAAGPGDVVAVEGMVAVSASVFVFVPDLTLTCATEGSGLTASAFIGGALIRGFEDGMTVSHLVLDGSNTTNGAFTGFHTGAAFNNLAGYTFRANTVTCGTITCLFTGGSTGDVRNNTFESPGVPVSGVHIQGAGFTNPDGSREFPTDGTRVVDNTFRSDNGSSNATWGAVRLRDARGAHVADNDIRGPWANGMGLANLGDALVEENRIDGAANQGILLWFGFVETPGFNRDNVIRRNRITGSGTAAFMAADACSNTYMGNNVGQNPLVMIFDAASGDNVLRGHRGKVVDNGALDCNGDGADDPNLISGSGKVSRDASVGQAMRDAARAVGEMN